MKNRRALLLLLALSAALLAAVPPGLADEGEEKTPPDPMNRVNATTPRRAGTRTHTILQYGPYTVHPGSDLSRIDFEVAALEGWVIGARPSVRLADGSQPGDEIVHIHHAHWVRIKDPQEWPNPPTSDYNDYLAWFFGTGEERTQGSAEDRAKVDPRYAQGLRYGAPVHRGDKMAFISMLHNKTSQPLVVWIQGEFDFVHGTREEIKAATGEDFRALTGVLHGGTFQVPRTGGIWAYPRDLGTTPSDWVAKGAKGGVIPGVGHVWVAPFDGTIVVAAGHLHPGGTEVVVSNLGSPANPCGSSLLDDADGDGFLGRTIERVQAYYPNGVFPSDGFQMGITKPGWRAAVRAGDRIAINGVYDTTSYAYPDAMSFFGFFTDQSEPPKPGEECSARLIDHPGASRDEIVMSQMNRPWGAFDFKQCTACDDLSKPAPAKGERTNRIHIGAFRYLTGDKDLVELTGAPVVSRSQPLTVFNEDWAAGLVRHSITTCRAPCNGGYYANYPFHDGVLDTGALGETPIDTYLTTKPAIAQFNVSSLDPGLYTYYCRLHTWMRGSFYLE